LGRTRELLFEQLGSSIPVLFLVVLVFWLTIIFASFALLPPKRNVNTAFFVCAPSVSGAIFLILELDRSFNKSREAVARCGCNRRRINGRTAFAGMSLRRGCG
jgi:hypothetical protein